MVSFARNTGLWYECGYVGVFPSYDFAASVSAQCNCSENARENYVFISNECEVIGVYVITTALVMLL